VYTNGTYNFQNITANVLITEAYERCGIIGDLISGLNIQSAFRSLNFMLSQWPNQGLRLWMLDNGMLNIVPGQIGYTLPDGTVDLLDLTVTNLTRMLNGTPYSSAGGVAANAFDGNPTTACIQTTANGYISYDYGLGNSVSLTYIGIQTNLTTSYNLEFDYSFDNVTWFPAFELGSLNYTLGQLQWFVLPSAYSARYWRVLETGGNILNIQEIYFDQPADSRLLGRIGRETYDAVSNKYNIAGPSSYFVDRIENPVVNFWPVMNTDYQAMVFRRKKQFHDIISLTQILQIPQYFFEPLVAGLAAKLSLKFAPDRFPLLKELSDESYGMAAVEDTERVPFTIQPDFMCYNI
jgi:hypothetical protein